MQQTKGTTIKLYRQDPMIGYQGVRKTLITAKVNPGPCDKLITLTGVPVVQPDKQGNFLLDHKKDPNNFDTVHTYGVVRLVLKMYKRALRMIDPNRWAKFQWEWGTQPIKVYPRAGTSPNSYYSRSEKALKFCVIKDNGREIPTCRSFEIVAQETGHAILDALKPGWWAPQYTQTAALHESFGDITALLTMLAQPGVCDTLLAETKCDLRCPTFFNEITQTHEKEQQICQSLGRRMVMRNCENNLKMSDVSDQVHELSLVFTGAIYDILVELYNNHYNDRLYDPAETLYRVGKHFRPMLMYAITQCPDKDVTFADMANKMIEHATNKHWDETWVNIIKTSFTKRLIIGPNKINNMQKITSPEKQLAHSTVRPQFVQA